MVKRKTILSMLSILIVMLSILIVPYDCQLSGGVVSINECASKLSCRDCIQTSSCAWCSDLNYNNATARCFRPEMSRECPEEFTHNPSKSYQMMDIATLSRKSSGSGGSGAAGYGSSWEESASYQYQSSMSSSSSSWSSSSGSSSGSSSSSGHSTQIFPQRVNCQLRMNQVFDFKMDYAQAEDYPLDLYYLMDLSKSMEDDKQSLSALGELLSQTMSNITSDFRLGFGSFVDKVLMPYVSTVPEKLKRPCDGCEAPYGYRNHMALDVDTAKFTGEVNRAAVSGNLDAPEGGFDAIMQAVVCREEIGWRKHARRLLVFSTDAGFHYAGDGKLGGVIEPNDGKCHLDSNGLYTYSSIQDYPSISQINLKVKQNAINVIFAVTEQQIGVYKKLSQHVEGSSSGVLNENSSNVVEFVKAQYNAISSSIEMKDNANGAIQVKYFSKCLNSSTEVQTNKCDGLKVGDLVTFRIELMVTSCPKDEKDWKQTFDIYPVGINERLTVDLDMLCSCPCEKPGSQGYEVKSPLCNNHGTLQCGVCECDPSHNGNTCECDATLEQTIDNSKCRPNNDTRIDCSGLGTCLCGRCECFKKPNSNERVYGPFCECDNFSCDRHNDLVCSGPANGKCECGKCECNPGWNGTACECRTSTDTCMNKQTNEICSGHGVCECGECRCDATEEGRWSGSSCEKCPTCAGRCQEFKHCVQCLQYNTGPLKDTCDSNCTLFRPQPVETVNYQEDMDEHLCVFYDEDDCKFQFVYSDTEPDHIVVRAQQDRECPPKVFIIGIVLAVIAAIVLIGLAVLLLWKLLTTIHDRREFARFEKERMMAKWDTGENPIYKQATSTFKNPTYAGK